MFGYLNTFIHQIAIKEIQELLELHPFYANNRADPKFQSAPVFVNEKYSFDGRQFPTILVNSTSLDEVRLDFSNLIDDVYGHVRTNDIIPIVVQKVEDDATYTGAYTNNVYAIDFVNVGREDKREIKFRVTDPTGSQYFDIKPWEIRTDIIPGARIMFGPFNDLEVGRRTYIQTFQNRQYLGNIYGKGFNFELNLTIYAQSQNECKELTDLLNLFFTFVLPQRFNNGYGIVLKNIRNGDMVEKDGELGEEVFKATFSVGGFTESHVFMAIPTVTDYQLFVMLVEQINGIIQTGQQ